MKLERRLHPGGGDAGRHEGRGMNNGKRGWSGSRNTRNVGMNAMFLRWINDMLLSLFVPFMPFRLLFMLLFTLLFVPFMPRKADNEFPARALFTDDMVRALPPGHGLRGPRLRPKPNPAKRGNRFDL